MLQNSVLERLSWEEYASRLSRKASDTERLVAAICYRFENEQVDATAVSVIADDYFRRARWTRPSNLSATANHCASKGWLAEVGRQEGRKMWRITRKGYNTIKERLTVSN